MKLSKSYWQTYKEVPSDAEVVSHKLLLRAGFINKTTGGIYTYLPMAVRVLNKIKKIVSSELEKTGAQEVLMSFVTPGDLWKKSGRWNSMSAEMVRFSDRKNSDFCLSATNEETITDVFSKTINSYKQLPVNLYQINTKFRDEIRPRFGLLRCREFIMKDAYTFSLDSKSMDEIYDDYFHAYSEAFKKMGLDFISVEADGGAMADAGSKTHEFQVIADNGEDEIVEVKNLNYAANIETAKTTRGNLDFCQKVNIEKVLTKDLTKCGQVASLLNIPVHQTLKSLVYTVTFTKKDGSNKLAYYMILLLGDDEINEVKLQNYFSAASNIQKASDEDIENLKLVKGFMSPYMLEISTIVDDSIDVNSSYVVGANLKDYHIKGFCIERDIQSYKKVDLRQTKSTDFGPDGVSPIKIRKGIEVGHIFQLGSKYTKSMDASILDKNGKKVFPLMGCYGIGISRTMAAAVEQSNDENGIIWPAQIAPYDIYFAVIGKKDSTKVLSNDLYEELRNSGLEVVFDDRGLGPGGMFKDSDLLGLPIRLVLGERDFESTGELEVKVRKTGKTIKTSRKDLVSVLKNELTSLGKEFNE